MCNVDLQLFSHIELLLASPSGNAWTGRYGCGIMDCTLVFRHSRDLIVSLNLHYRANHS
jgi:hypothetical protein